MIETHAAEGERSRRIVVAAGQRRPDGRIAKGCWGRRSVALRCRDAAIRGRGRAPDRRGAGPAAGPGQYAWPSARRRRRRLRPERAGRGDRARAGGAFGASCSRRAETVGGGMRTAELTLPGFVHDVCSAIHPLRGRLAVPRGRCRSRSTALEWIQPPAPLAHPLDDGTAALLERSVAATGATLGADARRYARLMAPLVERRRRCWRRPARPARGGRAIRPRCARFARARRCCRRRRSRAARFAGERARGAVRRARGALDAAARRGRRRRRSG